MLKLAFPDVDKLMSHTSLVKKFYGKKPVSIKEKNNIEKFYGKHKCQLRKKVLRNFREKSSINYGKKDNNFLGKTRVSIKEKSI